MTSQQDRQWARVLFSHNLKLMLVELIFLSPFLCTLARISDSKAPGPKKPNQEKPEKWYMLPRQHILEFPILHKILLTHNLDNSDDSIGFSRRLRRDAKLKKCIILAQTLKDFYRRQIPVSQEPARFARSWVAALQLDDDGNSTLKVDVEKYTEVCWNRAQWQIEQYIPFLADSELHFERWFAREYPKMVDKMRWRPAENRSKPPSLSHPSSTQDSQTLFDESINLTYDEPLWLNSVTEESDSSSSESSKSLL